MDLDVLICVFFIINSEVSPLCRRSRWMGCSRKGEEEEERKKKREREREREKRGMIFSIFDLDLEGLKKS